LYNGASWTKSNAKPWLGADAISCGATYFCVATDLVGGAHVFNGTAWLSTKVSNSTVLRGVSCASASTCVAVNSDQAFSLSVPTARTRVSFVTPARGWDVVGRTIVAARVSAAAAPTGAVVLSAGTLATSPSCVATLKRVSATVSSAHCTIRSVHVGTTLMDARFTGSFGFAPSIATLHYEKVVAR
jgi:hypothetical protein